MRRGYGARENRYVLIYGAKGMGKTLLLRSIVRAAQRAGRSTVYIDRADTGADLGAVVRTPAAWWVHARAALRTGRPYRLTVQPGRGVSLDPLWAMLWEVGDVLVAIDEAEAYANAHRIDPELESLVNLGRNRGVDIATTVRTPPELHGRLRGNADAVFTFRQPSRLYADSLNREFFHLQDPRILMQLPRFRYLRASEGNVSVGRVSIG